MMRWASALIAAFALCVAPQAAEAASNATRMTVAFTPLRLGAPTAITFTFQIADKPSMSLLTGLRVAYPSSLGFATSGLGVASCDPVVLAEEGPSACPANSHMGTGAAVVQLPFGPFLVKEQVRLVVLAAPSPDGYFHLLISAAGEVPVKAQLILSGELRDGHLIVAVPPIPGLPEGPYVAVAKIQMTIGGRLTYYEHRHGRIVAYHPPGVGLPPSCPRRGFPFGATFKFLDGSSSSARTVVRCPGRR